jgi:hypothetical protein
MTTFKKKLRMTEKSLFSHISTMGILMTIIGLFPVLVFSQELDPAKLPAELFKSEEILDLKLSGDTKTLFNDRTENGTYHPMTISYIDEQGQEVAIPLKVTTRGHFRLMRGNCFYPPLRLNFARKKTPEGSLFAGQDKLKLVTPCRDEEFVVQEYLVYKLYNLITEKSFKARLVRVVYEDTERGKPTDPLYGIILEDQDQMAARNNTKIVKVNGIRPNKTAPEYFLPVAVFEYMIGNTDWSTQYRHNIKILRDDSNAILIPVPYDFDHAGIVQTPYAKPSPALKLHSVRERRYRGYCVEDMSVFEPVIARFNELKEEFYKVYTECPMLKERYVRQTLRYLDNFYETINDPEEMEKAFSYPCLAGGTGNVVIKGLRN